MNPTLPQSVPQIWTIPGNGDARERESFFVVDQDNDDDDTAYDLYSPQSPMHRAPPRARRYSGSYSGSSSGSSSEDSDNDSVDSQIDMGPVVGIHDTEALKAMNARVLRIDDIFDEEESCRVALPYNASRFAPEDKKEAIVSIEKTEGCVLVLRRVFYRDGSLNKTVLDIRSPLIRKILKKCILEEKASLDTGSALEWPHDLVFRYRDHIKLAAAEEDELTVSHVNVLLNLVETDYSFYISEIKAKFPKGATTFDILREAFLPGEIIVSGSGNDICGYRVVFAKYVWQTKRNSIGRVRKLKVCADYTSCNGTGFGTLRHEFHIDDFQGVRYLNQLCVYPLRVHPNADAVREKLFARGRRYATLKGQSFRYVKGDVTTTQGSRTTTIDSRVVIDIKGAARLENYPRSGPRPALIRGLSKQHHRYQVPSLLPNRLSPLKEPLPIPKSSDTLVGEDLLICSNNIEMWSVRDKQFYNGKVDMLQDIVFNTDLFDQLVIDPRTKNLARIMVERHIKGSTFDDFVEGKGKGLVMLLHGPPGVGKTMMAEAIAEHTKRPLYAISSGELGANPVEMERKLAHILDIAHTFKAVLLLDEADVFLERRTSQNLIRNALVSIFLRMLEYYPGILILTSNRAETFDEAFHSRIHLTFAFSSLDYQSRELVWRNFAAQRKEGVTLTDADFKELAKHPLNGRQIKNTFSAAAELAGDCGEQIGARHIHDVLMVLLTSPLLRIKQTDAQ